MWGSASPSLRSDRKGELLLILRQVNVQSAQPAQAGGAAETNQKHALALLFTLLLLFAQRNALQGLAT